MQHRQECAVITEMEAEEEEEEEDEEEEEEEEHSMEEEIKEEDEPGKSTHSLYFSILPKCRIYELLTHFETTFLMKLFVGKPSVWFNIMEKVYLWSQIPTTS